MEPKTLIIELDVRRGPVQFADLRFGCRGLNTCHGDMGWEGWLAGCLGCDEVNYTKAVTVVGEGLLH